MFIDMREDPLTPLLQEWMHGLWNLAQVLVYYKYRLVDTHTAFNHCDSRLLILPLPWPQLVKVHDSMFLCALRKSINWAQNPNHILISVCFCARLLSIFQNVLNERHYYSICGRASEGSGFIFKFSSEWWMTIDSPASLKLVIRSA